MILDSSSLLENLLNLGKNAKDKEILDIYKENKIRKSGDFFIDEKNTIFFAFSEKGIIIFVDHMTIFSEYNGDFIVKSNITNNIHICKDQKPEHMYINPENRVITHFENYAIYTDKNMIFMDNGIYENSGIESIEIYDKEKIINIAQLIYNKFNYFEKYKINNNGKCLPIKTSTHLEDEISILTELGIVNDTSILLKEFNLIDNENDFEIMKEKIKQYNELIMLCSDNNFYNLIDSLNDIQIIADNTKKIIKNSNTNKVSINEDLFNNNLFLNKLNNIKSYDAKKLGKYGILNLNLNELYASFIKFRKEIINNMQSFKKNEKNKFVK